MARIEDVISKDEELSGQGRWLKGVDHDSLVVDTEKQIFFWNSKGVVGDVYVWLTKIRGMSHEKAKEYLKPLDGFSGSFIQNIRNTEEYVVYPKLVDLFYENGLRASMKYWDDRGISLQTVHRFKLGFNDGYYTIPIYQDGLFKNFQLRRDEPKKDIRYYYKNSKRLMFNADIMKVTSTIIITEGPTDCLRLLQEGVPCVSHTGGSEGWFDEWFKYFIHQKRIYVAYDNDHAGRNGAKKVARNLGIYRTKIYTFDGFGDKYDIGDFFVEGHTKEELMELLTKESKYLFELE